MEVIGNGRCCATTEVSVLARPVRAASPVPMMCPTAPALRPSEPPVPPPPAFSPSLLGGTPIPVTIAMRLLNEKVAAGGDAGGAHHQHYRNLARELNQLSLRATSPAAERAAAGGGGGGGRSLPKPKTILRTLRRSRKKKAHLPKGPFAAKKAARHPRRAVMKNAA